MAFNPSPLIEPFPFLRLPLELQIRICSSFCTHCPESPDYPFPPWPGSTEGTLILGYISLTCSSLREIAQPIMYHWPAVHRWEIFAHTLGKRPDLAASYKCFSLSDNLTHRFRRLHGWMNSIWYHEELNVYKKVARQLQLDEPNDPDFLICCRYEEEGTLSNIQFDYFQMLFTSIFLSIAPNLQSIWIDVNNSFTECRDAMPFGYRYMDTYIKRVGEISFPLLQRLEISRPFRHNHRSLGVDRISFLLNAAPNLQELVINDAQGEYVGYMPDYDYKTIWQGLKKLEILRFHGMRCSPELTVPYAAIQSIAKESQQLKEFIIIPINTNNYNWKTPNPFSPRRLLEALLPLATSLQRLTLYSSYISLKPDKSNINIGLILRQFIHLEHLYLDEQCFCSHWISSSNSKQHIANTCLASIIPSTLVSLTIRLHDRYKATTDIIGLGKRIQAGEFKTLKTFKVHVLYELHLKRYCPWMGDDSSNCLPNCILCGAEKSEEPKIIKALADSIRPLILNAFEGTAVTAQVVYKEDHLLYNFMDDVEFGNLE